MTVNNWTGSTESQIKRKNEVSNEKIYDVTNKIQIVPRKPKKQTTIPLYKLYKYATKKEILWLILGVSISLLMNIVRLEESIVNGEFISLMLENSDSSVYILKYFGARKIENITDEKTFREGTIVNSWAFTMGYGGGLIFEFILQMLCLNIFNSMALKQINRIRYKFLEAVLKQDMIWYDTNTSMNFVSYLTDDLDRIKDGIAERAILFLFVIVNTFVALISSFCYGWKLTAAILICAPFVALCTFISTKYQESLNMKESSAYSKAGSVVEEVLSAIRTVIAFGGEEKEVKRYEENLENAANFATKRGFYTGFWSGAMWVSMYCGYAIALWYGSKLIIDGRLSGNPEYTTGILTMIMFSLVGGAQYLGYSLPYLESFSKAQSSATTVYSIIDRLPTIDSMSTYGKKLPKLSGDVSLRNVRFYYPARPDVQILDNLSLEIRKGEKVVLVGPSGCGKSTIVQLIQRLYDPQVGHVYFDGEDVKLLNLKWLRKQIAVVGQEPILFATTIAENIKYGNPMATREEIEAAAKVANCHDFIEKLPHGYDTLIGEKGAQLSGGQKQRIAIARAVIKKPTILLLDEATSALDRYNEKIVQEALDRISANVTTISVTHRLTSIARTDRIVFVEGGQIKEMGTHQQLMERKMLYYKLFTLHRESEDEDSRNIENPEDNVLETDAVENEGDESESDAEAIPFITRRFSKKPDEDIKSSTFNRIIQINRPEWSLIVGGCLMAIIMGSTLPAFAVLMGAVYTGLKRDDLDEVNWYAMGIVIIGLVNAAATFLQSYMFTKSGARLTTRLRKLCFESVLKQEMAWYDRDDNNVGSISARLASDAVSVQNATGTVIGILLQTSSVVLLGLVFATYYAWQIGLVSVPILPTVFFILWLENYVNKKSTILEKTALERASRIAVEAINNIKTVQSLCLEEEILRQYEVELDKIYDLLKRKIRFRGVTFSINRIAPGIAHCGVFYYSGYLIANGAMDLDNMIKSCEAITLGIWIIGLLFAFTPDFNAAKLSAKRIFKLIDRQPKISSNATAKNTDWNCDGGVKFANVSFSYPTRSNIQVLNNLTLNIPKGKSVALVGQSGCGKSTCIQMLQRLYEPTSGQIKIDDQDIHKDVKIPKLRNQLGLVSQEPVLFNRSIAENIAYGDNTRIVDPCEIIEAAKKANIHTFITNLPLGYDTPLGAKGANLSGGQKQRIAIARALVRNPRILLLDEATSALDNESEKIVQEALDAACKDRTCIIIAHRLRTVQNADLICVIENGQVIETGTHAQLMAKKTAYRALYAINQ